MGDPGVLGLDLGIQRFSLGNDAAAQILQQALGRAFDQIQRRTRLQQQPTADVREMAYAQHRPSQLGLCRPAGFVEGR